MLLQIHTTGKREGKIWNPRFHGHAECSLLRNSATILHYIATIHKTSAKVKKLTFCNSETGHLRALTLGQPFWAIGLRLEGFGRTDIISKVLVTHGQKSHCALHQIT